MDFRSEATLMRRLSAIAGTSDREVCMKVFKYLRKRGYFARDVVVMSIPDEILSEVYSEVISNCEDIV